MKYCWQFNQRLINDNPNDSVKDTYRRVNLIVG